VESPRKGEKVAESFARCAHDPSHVLASIIRTQTDASATARSPMSLEAKRADAHPHVRFVKEAVSDRIA
jgi:hypothetical protein